MRAKACEQANFIAKSSFFVKLAQTLFPKGISTQFKTK